MLRKHIDYLFAALFVRADSDDNPLKTPFFNAVATISFLLLLDVFTVFIALEITGRAWFPIGTPSKMEALLLAFSILGIVSSYFRKRYKRIVEEYLKETTLVRAKYVRRNLAFAVVTFVAFFLAGYLLMRSSEV